MLEVKKSIESGQPYGLYDILKQLQTLGVAIGGDVFFVDATNGSDSYNGQSWATAFKTLAYAITKSNLSVLEHTDGRNTILLRGALFAEDLTVPPIKCDVIGAGSSDEQNMVKITGEHSWTGSATNESSGFYNIEFQNDGTTEIFTVASVAGLYFENCRFTAEAACTGAMILSGTTAHDLVIKNCWFRNALDNDFFDTAAISITATTFYHMLIKDCEIEGDIGINVDCTNAYNCIVRNCLIKATTFCVDDESDDVIYDTCHFISAVDNTTNNDTIVDWNVALAINCQVTGSNHTDDMPTVAA